jgi:hypothetical protein
MLYQSYNAGMVNPEVVLLNLGGSVYGVWVLVNKLNLYNLVVVYTIGSMAGLMHWFYPKDNSLLWQQLYRFLNKAIYYVQV